jgi:hypothetical protein
MGAFLSGNQFIPGQAAIPVPAESSLKRNGLPDFATDTHLSYARYAPSAPKKVTLPRYYLDSSVNCRFGGPLATCALDFIVCGNDSGAIV